MIQNIFDNIKIVRRIKGGYWIKTQKRGWIDFELFNDYLSYAFDPVGIKSQHFKKMKMVSSETFINK